jgi:uncharacterized protein YxeA
MKEKNIKQLSECGKETHFNFQLMKNHYRKGYFTLHCCAKGPPKCGVIVFTSRESDVGSFFSSTVVMIVILLMVVLVLFFFLRSNSPNLDYDEELKYTHNLRYKGEVEQHFRQPRPQGGLK